MKPSVAAARAVASAAPAVRGVYFKAVDHACDTCRGAGPGGQAAWARACGEPHEATAAATTWATVASLRAVELAIGAVVLGRGGAG